MSKLSIADALDEAAETNAWKCETCAAPSETASSRYCLSCRLYWDDCANGLWDHDDDWASFPTTQGEKTNDHRHQGTDHEQR